MAATVKPGMTIVFVGDSITAGTPPPDGWFTPALATLQPELATKGKVTVTGNVATSTGRAAQALPVDTLTIVNSGVGGDTAQNLETQVASRITNFTPNIVVILIGINDLLTNNTATATFRTYLDSIWTQVLAADPTAQLVGVSLFLWHEQWTSTPVDAWDNAFDPAPGAPRSPSIAEYVAQIQASVTSFGGTFVETRTECLNYEVAHNTPEPGVVFPVISLDGLHPNSIGQGLISNQFLANLTVVP